MVTELWSERQLSARSLPNEQQEGQPRRTSPQGEEVTSWPPDTFPPKTPYVFEQDHSCVKSGHEVGLGSRMHGALRSGTKTLWRLE
jgi:hypothetical protein